MLIGLLNDIRTIDDMCNSCLVLNECTHRYALFCKRIIRILRMNGKLIKIFRGEKKV